MVKGALQRFKIRSFPYKNPQSKIPNPNSKIGVDPVQVS